MAIKPPLKRGDGPVEVVFIADGANNAHAFIDHYRQPDTNASSMVFGDVAPGMTSTTQNTVQGDSRRFYVEYNIAAGDKGTLQVSQKGAVIAKGTVPDGDTFWIFGVIP